MKLINFIKLALVFSVIVLALFAAPVSYASEIYADKGYAIGGHDSVVYFIEGKAVCRKT